jgi:cobalamin biosynthesis protein CobT
LGGEGGHLSLDHDNDNNDDVDNMGDMDNKDDKDDKINKDNKEGKDNKDNRNDENNKENWNNKDCDDNAEQFALHFRMEGAKMVQYVSMKEDWTAKTDLESVFNHNYVSDGIWRLFCFRYADESYDYVGMPFGSEHAPRWFSNALGFAIRSIRLNWDICIMVHMDYIPHLLLDLGRYKLYTLQIASYLQCLVEHCRSRSAPSNHHNR